MQVRCHLSVQRAIFSAFLHFHPFIGLKTSGRPYPPYFAHIIFTHQDHPRLRQEHVDQLGNS